MTYWEARLRKAAAEGRLAKLVARVAYDHGIEFTECLAEIERCEQVMAEATRIPKEEK